MTGLIQVYTGDGKGKTTAAFGLAMRALGRGLKVTFMQFLKSGVSGEILLGQTLPELNIIRVNTSEKFTWTMNEEELQFMQKEIEQGFEQAIQIARSGKCNILILDEMVHILNKGNISREAFETFLASKPEHLEIILTGRNAPEWLIERADLVSEMRCIKHPFQQGIAAREGIED
jgi:cob(I)alamin adenosyltransferase